MKKILAILLCVAAVSALFVGCAPTDADGTQLPKGVFEAGYGRVDITPDPQHSYDMAGYGAGRPSSAVLDSLYITCTALKDEDGNTYLLYNCDFLKVFTPLNLSKPSISKATGVPVENIMISTTHTHSAPGLEYDTPVIIDYVKIVKKAMVKAGEDAVADLKPAKIYTTEIVCEGFNYIRSVGVPVSLMGEELDNTMELIKLTREGGKDIVMLNWQGHPRASAPQYSVMSDVDIIRKNIEPALDCNFMFFLGASGNVGNRSDYETYVEHYEALTDLAVQAAANFKEVNDGLIKKTTTKVTLEFKTPGNNKDEVTISVITIGKSVAFVIVPYEMFSYSAKQLKAYSPFDQTIIVTCTAGHIGYLPTIDTPSDEYEVGATFYVMGSAELLVDNYKTILDQAYGK